MKINTFPDVALQQCLLNMRVEKMNTVRTADKRKFERL